jgi:hypothetical protein
MGLGEGGLVSYACELPALLGLCELPALLGLCELPALLGNTAYSADAVSSHRRRISQLTLLNRVLCSAGSCKPGPKAYYHM